MSTMSQTPLVTVDMTQKKTCVLHGLALIKRDNI